MRKSLCVLLALLIAFSLAFASAENLAALLASSANRSTGNEAEVYDALYAVLNRINGGELPLDDWSDVNNYLSKCDTREELDEDETIFDQSISAYEKLFLTTLQRATLSDEDAAGLAVLFEDALAELPEDGAVNLYMPSEGGAFLTDLMAKALGRLGWSCAPEALDGALSLNAVLDPDGKVVLTARDALTGLPGAILMKRVPAARRAESARVLAFIQANSPCAIDWAALSGDADFVVDEAEETSVPVTFTDEELDADATRWLELLYASDALDSQLRAGLEADTARVNAAVAALSQDRAAAVREPGGLSLAFTGEAAEPTATPTPSAGPTATPSPKAIAVPADYTQDRLIYVSKGSHTIAVVKRDANGEFTKAERTFPTSIGKAGQTKAGTYTISKKERWHSWSGATYSPYSCRTDRGTFIHGPLFSAKNPNSLIASSYNEIGSNATSGCLQTTTAAARWVYNISKAGKTLMIIADDSRFKASRPKKIPKDQTYDPTDSDAAPEPEDEEDPDASPSPSASTSPSPSPSASTAPTTSNSPTPTPKPVAGDPSEEPVAGDPSEEPGGQDEPTGDTVIDDHAKPEDIQHVQELLIVLKELDEGDADGIYGPKTTEAVTHFQKVVNQDEGRDVLEVSGVVDSLTLQYLEQYAERARKAAEQDPDDPDNSGGDNPGGDNSGGDNPGGDNPGGDNPGGDNPGGDNPGGDNPGGDNPGGDNPGGDNSGGDNPGGDNPGGDNSGGDNPGGDNPGGDNPGGDNPGGDNPGGDNPGGNAGDNPGGNAGDNPGGGDKDDDKADGKDDSGSEEGPNQGAGSGSQAPSGSGGDDKPASQEKPASQDKPAAQDKPVDGGNDENTSD